MSSPECNSWRRWRQLVNMTPSELERFLASPDGKSAGLSASEARNQGIKSGRESARWLLKMIPTGGTFSQAVANWTPSMWRWSKRQVAFISRMRGNKGPLFDGEGERTRKHTSLLVWGHNPQKPMRKVPPCE